MFEKVFSWQELIEHRITDHTKLAVIRNKSSETRNIHEKLAEAVQKLRSTKEVLIEYNAEYGTLEYDNSKYSLTRGIDKILQECNGYSVLINITTMNLQVLGALLNQMRYYSFEEVFCLYTKPRRYARREDSERHFDLHRKLLSENPIQGFVSLGIEAEESQVKWVPFLGFEGNRPIMIQSKYELEWKDCIPVMTLPSYRPAWQNIIIKENLNFLTSRGSTDIHYVEADSFVDAYEELDRLANTYKDYYLRVSPFGTKINAMGILLYSMNHEGQIDIIYDNPIEDGAAISEDCGDTLIFDVSEYIPYEERRS